MIKFFVFFFFFFKSCNTVLTVLTSEYRIIGTSAYIFFTYYPRLHLEITELCIVHVMRRPARIHTYTHIRRLAVDQYERSSTGCPTKQPAATGLCWESHSVIPLTPWWDLISVFIVFWVPPGRRFPSHIDLPSATLPFPVTSCCCHPIERSWQIIRTALNQSLPIFHSQPLQLSSIH
jgi:hypothetical protein